jgi:flagellar protein FlbD
MIKVTLEGKTDRQVWLNPHQIEYIEESGHMTVILMLSGKRLVVQEPYKVLYDRIVSYRREVGAFKNEE